MVRALCVCLPPAEGLQLTRAARCRGLVAWLHIPDLRGTLHILTKAASLTKAKSYQNTVLALMGPTAANIINLSMYLYLFGCCVGACVDGRVGEHLATQLA